MLYRDIIKFETKKGEIKDLTKNVRDVVKKSRIKNGLCHVYFLGTTGAVIINENDPLVLEDFKKTIDVLVPSDKMYIHPSNAYSHIRSMMMNNNFSIPVSDNEIILGIYQTIMFAEFDTTNRTREIILTISGD